MLEVGNTIRTLLVLVNEGLRPMPLVPGSPFECRQLEDLRLKSTPELFRGATISSMSDAKCVHAGLYLYFSALDESHTISQTIHTPSGSYWHGIMHRQEGDWSNARYWFRRTGSHPVFSALEEETGKAWDPFDFVDLCAKDSARQAQRGSLVRLQMAEWRLLMAHCYRGAVGG